MGGCSRGGDAVSTAPAPVAKPVVATAAQTQQAATAEQALRGMGVPIYTGAVVDPFLHSYSDDQGSDAVFTTTDSVAQVVAFYKGYSDLALVQSQGSNLFHGTINGKPMGIEVRLEDGKTHIIAQARNP